MTLFIVVTIIISGLFNLWLVSHILSQGFETRATLEGQLKHLDTTLFKNFKKLNDTMDILIISMPRKRLKEDAPEAKA